MFVLIFSEISAFIFPGSSVRDRLRTFLLESRSEHQHRELLERSSSSGLYIVFLIVVCSKFYWFSHFFLLLVILQKLYYKYSRFLPYVNNERNTTKSGKFKRGITKLQHMVLIGSPEDGVITPWQSSHFGYYDANETVIAMRNRPIYMDDSIGLKTLDENGKLTLITVPNVPHYEWHKNVSIVDDFLLPYLD